MGFGEDEDFDFNEDDFGGNSGGFGKSDGFGSSSGGFGDGDFGSSFSDDDFGGGNSDDGGDFSGEFETGLEKTNAYGNEIKSPVKLLKKQAIIVIAVGVVGLLLLLFLAGSLEKMTSRDEEATLVGTEAAKETVRETQKEVVISNDNNVVDSKDGWKTLDGKTKVKFNKEYAELTFTVTDIKNYAKVNGDSNISIKAVLKGSLSGMTGSYDLEVPFNVSGKLVVGDSFDVQVQLGTYSGKTVVGQIKY